MVLFPNQVNLCKYFLIFSADDETIPTTFGSEMYLPWLKDETQSIINLLSIIKKLIITTLKSSKLQQLRKNIERFSQNYVKNFIEKIMFLKE